MATATMEPKTAVMANETEIANAIGVLRHAGLADDVLDEIELDRRLAISLEQANNGTLRPTKEIVNEILGELKRGYYNK